MDVPRIFVGDPADPAENNCACPSPVPAAVSSIPLDTDGFWRLAPDLFRGLAGIDFGGLGIPDEAAYLAAYRRRTGIDPGVHWEFYLVYSLFRVAAILQGIAKRALDGTAASAQASALGVKAAPIAAHAWSMAQATMGR